MTADFRVKVGFFRHHKTKLLKKRLGLPGVVALMQLWEYAAEFKSDGDLSGMTDEQIEVSVGWEGEKSLVAALKEEDTRFLDGEERAYRLHDWHEHNPWVSDTELRSDQGRLSRLCRARPEIGAQLKAAGRTGVSAEEYQMYVRTTTVEPSLKEPSTTVEPPLKEPQYVCSTDDLLQAPTPVPTPTPVPVPTPVVEDYGGGAAPPPPPPAKKPRSADKPNVAPKVHGTRMREDWLVPETWIDWAVEQGLDRETAIAEGPSFRDYWLSVSGTGGVKADWFATWRNRVRWLLKQPNGKGNGIRAAPQSKDVAEHNRQVAKELGLEGDTLEGEYHVVHGK